MMMDITKLQTVVKVSTIIKDILLVVIVCSFIAVVGSIIKSHGKISLFDYYYEYYDEETGKIIKTEKISKEEYYRNLLQ